MNAMNMVCKQMKGKGDRLMCTFTEEKWQEVCTTKDSFKQLIFNFTEPLFLISGLCVGFGKWGGWSKCQVPMARAFGSFFGVIFQNAGLYWVHQWFTYYV